MTIDFKNISGGTVASQIGDPVVLTDGEVYPYTVDTIVSDVSYSRTIDAAHTAKALCVPFDIYYSEEMAEGLELFTIVPQQAKWNELSPVSAFGDYIKVGTVIPANTPLIMRSKTDNYTYTFHGDNRKGYVVLKAGLGKPHYTDKSNYVANTAEGKWRFFPVQEKITRGEFGQDMYYIAKGGAINRGTKDTTSVNSYRWIFCHDDFIKTPKTYNVKDIVYSDGTVSQAIDNSKTPVGVVVIPSGFLPDGKARIMSLNYVSSTDTTGTANEEPIKWGTVREQTELLDLYGLIPKVDITTGAVIGTAKWSRMPSDTTSTLWQGAKSLDTKAKWFTNDGDHSPSPYIKNNAGEEVLATQFTYNTGSGSSLNALSDFDGLGNTNKLKDVQDDGGYKYLSAHYASLYKPAGDDKNTWYLPACGEAAFMLARFSEINKVLNKMKQVPAWKDLGITPIKVIDHWTSTEYNNNSARIIYFDKGAASYTAKDNGNNVRAFAQVG